MAKVIEAIYENGVFKPLEKVDLKEGEKVRIRIEKRRIYDVIKEYQKYFEDIDEDLTEILLSERR
ncbi:antitoxin family protein [Ferroglobus sp.]|uniref:antitoxin family protein n=1 Tax=Ferroglobus sp. TaxID=2614230 RepID=UPI0025BF37E2|nr:antitoxin family protein [Ferroglobus sp.]